VVIVPGHECGGIGAEPPGSAVGVVLIRRRFEPLAGEWSLPGGAIEAGETLDAAVAREVREETGLVVTVGPLITALDRIVPDASGGTRYHFVLLDYVCRVTGGRLRAGSDASDAVVADPARLEPYGLTAEARAVIVRGVALAAGDFA
jgi:ADP-ribose pyrophosphatase YjhB (NUDIX family)